MIACRISSVSYLMYTSYCLKILSKHKVGKWMLRSLKRESHKENIISHSWSLVRLTEWFLLSTLQYEGKDYRSARILHHVTGASNYRIPTVFASGFSSSISTILPYQLSVLIILICFQAFSTVRCEGIKEPIWSKRVISQGILLMTRALATWPLPNESSLRWIYT